MVQRVLGQATTAMTMDLYGHMVDDNLWQAARVVGSILEASELSGRPDPGAGEAEAGSNAW